jgi:hypothetical protein
MSSQTNPALRQLRETAEILGRPQRTVAANWLRSPAMTRYSPSRSVGVTRAEFDRAQLIMRRLARAAAAL